MSNLIRPPGKNTKPTNAVKTNTPKNRKNNQTDFWGKTPKIAPYPGGRYQTCFSVFGVFTAFAGLCFAWLVLSVARGSYPSRTSSGKTLSALRTCFCQAELFLIASAFVIVILDVPLSTAFAHRSHIRNVEYTIIDYVGEKPPPNPLVGIWPANTAHPQRAGDKGQPLLSPTTSPLRVLLEVEATRLF